MRVLLVLVVILFQATSVHAQSRGSQADILGTKAYLESLLIQRFSNELATKVEKSLFQISAHIQVNKIKPKKKQSKDTYTYTDLDLGFLDPERLLSNSEESEISHFLSKYRIRKVSIRAGLSSTLSTEIKAKVEKWLAERVRQEFGVSGTSEVQYIAKPVESIEPPVQKTPLDTLKDLQDLAGQIVLALALILGAILFALLGRPTTTASTDPNTSVNVQNTFETEGAGAGGATSLGDGSLHTETMAHESLNKRIADLSRQIVEIAPKVTSELDNVVKEWCRAGESGFEQVACFAQVVGQTIGRVPIPEEFRQNVTDVFSRMYQLGGEQKLDILTRVYWDLMAVLNLGTESLHRPFSFLGSASSIRAQKVLLENSPEVQAVAAYYMPEKQRRAYFAGLGMDQKIKLLEEASSLEKLKYSELEDMEAEVAPMFSDDSEEKIIVLSKALSRLVEVMSFKESVVLLKDIKGPVLQEYKRSHPSLAFLHEWPEEPLTLFVQQVGQDELMTLLAVRRDLKDKIIEVLPPRMRQIVEEDFGVIQNLKDSEIEQNLTSLHKQLVLFVENGFIDLSTAFNVELRAVSSDSAA